MKYKLIKEEIERRINVCEKYSQLNLTESTRIGNHAQLLELRELKDFIDSHPEEPASEDLEEEFNRFLDEEGVPRMWHSDEQMEWGMDIARHFAEWQKQQMMKDAVVTEVMYPASSSTLQIRYRLPKDTTLKYGDNIKIIIVKEN